MFLGITIKDILAALTLVALVYIKMLGITDGVDPVISAFIGYYFGHRKSGVDSGK